MTKEFIDGIRHAAKLIEENGWNDTFTTVNQKVQAERSAAFLRWKAEQLEKEWETETHAKT
jgi:hypothetical protein